MADGGEEEAGGGGDESGGEGRGRDAGGGDGARRRSLLGGDDGEGGGGQDGEDGQGLGCDGGHCFGWGWRGEPRARKCDLGGGGGEGLYNRGKWEGSLLVVGKGAGCEGIYGPESRVNGSG